MDDSTITRTQSEVVKLRILIEELAQELEKRKQSGTAYTGGEDVRLLTKLRLATEELARGVESQEKERQSLRALQDVGAIINSSLEQTQVLNTVMDTIIQLTGSERSFLMLFDEQTRELNVEVARNINQETIEESSFEISRSIVESVANSGEPVVTTNAQADPRFSSQESIISYNLRSILCVPLKIKENIIGVVYADNRIMSGIFVDADRDLLAAFANQAAVAIENARLFEQIREQLADITEMKNLQDDVFESIASGVITIDLADRVSLFNRAAERILGIPSYRVMDKDFRMLFTSMESLVENMIEEVQNSGGHFNTEIDTVLTSQKGTATLNLTLTPLRDIRQDTRGVALVVEDISEKKRMESVRRYLPPALVDQVRDVDAAQRPQRRDISVLFGDIRGFSTVAEKWDPEFLIGALNNHLTAAATAINEYGGLIDKYDGDLVMALYNTPLNPQEDHAKRAVETALDVRDKVLEYHQTIPEDECLYFGIGIHSGEAVVGNVGSPLRKDYSAIGDAVNLAERLQQIAKPNQILISEATYMQVEDRVVVNKLDPLKVKGRQTLEQIYELVSLKGD
ncbi:MAG: hypothetical protein BMS9Abin02_0909 [Anaerolineae bacterium]|nr:MAG: hypothetical protein BMS9Abin02_0909 [Anaerolineae bacterium]